MMGVTMMMMVMVIMTAIVMMIVRFGDAYGDGDGYAYDDNTGCAYGDVYGAGYVDVIVMMTVMVMLGLWWRGYSVDVIVMRI